MGKYIVFEGHDGTGKSTQVRMLAQHLESKGIDTYIPEEPAGTPIADKVREIIKNGDLARDGLTNVLLFTAARRSIWQRAQRELKTGRWVISARNYLSTLAYQGYGEGIDLDLIIDTTRTFTDETYMKPDHTIILTLGDEVERKRRITERGVLQNPDTFEARGEDFQSRVNDAYFKIAERFGYPLVDASQPPDNVQAEIRQIIGV